MNLGCTRGHKDTTTDCEQHQRPSQTVGCRGRTLLWFQTHVRCDRTKRTLEQSRDVGSGTEHSPQGGAQEK